MSDGSSSSSSSPEPVTLAQLDVILTQFREQMEQALAAHLSQAQHAQVATPVPSSAASAASVPIQNPLPATGSFHFTGLPSKVKLSPPSNFTGTRTINTDAWIFEMEQYLRICGVPEPQKVNVAS